jgi:hypothetical protein
MLDQLLGASKSGIVSSLTSQLGLSPDQANGLIAKVVPMLEGLFKSGNVDVSKLMAGDFSGLTSKLDMASLTQLVGGDATKAKEGVTTIATGLADAAKSSPDLVETLVGQLSGAGGAGGIAGAISGGLGKLFGKS